MIISYTQGVAGLLFGGGCDFWEEVPMEAHIWTDLVSGNSPKFLGGQPGAAEALWGQIKATRGMVREGDQLPCKHAPLWRNKRGRCCGVFLHLVGEAQERCTRDARHNRGCRQLCQSGLGSFHRSFHLGTCLSSILSHEGQETGSANCRSPGPFSEP